MTRIIASDELENAGVWRRFAVRFHLFRCRHCREYEAQLRTIGDAVRGLFRGGEADDEGLRRLEREILGGLGTGGEEKRDPGGGAPSNA